MSGSLFEDGAVRIAFPRRSPLADRMRPQRPWMKFRAGPSARTRKAAANCNRTRSGAVDDPLGPRVSAKRRWPKIIARMTKSDFIPFSAVLSGIKEIKEIMASAERAQPARPSNHSVRR